MFSDFIDILENSLQRNIAEMTGIEVRRIVTATVELPDIRRRPPMQSSLSAPPFPGATKG